MVIVWLVGLLLVGGVMGDPVEIKETEYSTLAQNLGDLPFEMLYAEVEFEEELEYSENLFCSTQNYKKFPSYQPATCIPCNYSGPSEEGFGCVDTDLNVMLPHLEGLGLPNCPCDRSFCEGELLTADTGPRRYTIRERDLKLNFRYEHSDVNSGFLVRITPIDEGPLFLTVSNSNDLETEHILGELYTTEPSLSSVKVCPSFDRFGEGSPSITYFIKVLVGDIEGKELATFDLSIESIPNLLPEEEDDYQELTFWPGAAFANLSSGFSNSPIYLKGTSLAESNGGTEPRYYPIGALIPLTECISYSVSVELLNLNTEVFNYFTLVSVWSEILTLAEAETLATPRQRPFKIIEAVEATFKTTIDESISSNGQVWTVCPTGVGTPENPEYIAIRISSSPFFNDYSLLVFVREVTRDTRTRKNYPLSEFSPLDFQRKFHMAPIVRCSCNEGCDDCESRDATVIRYFNRLSGLSPETFPALQEKTVPGCDLAAQIGISIRNELHYRCISPWRDTTCGVIRTIPVFESANPRIYPIPEVARLENAFSFPAAPDFLGNITSNQKVRGNKMGFLFTLTGGDVRYFDEERLINQCELGFAPQLNLHSFNDMPIDAKYRPFKSVKPADTQCSQSNFDKIASLLNQAQQELRDLTRSGVLVGENVDVSAGKNDLTADELVESSSGATYASYSLLFSQEWQSCQNLANSFVVFETVNKTLTDSAACGSTYDPDDPCCNEQLAWETCCFSEGRDVVLENIPEPLFENNEQIEEECLDSECIETFVQDYRITYQEVFLSNVCENEFVIETGLNRVLSQCREEWIGNDEFGMLCYTDSDCTDIYETGQCDTVNNRCTGVRKEMELGFLGCLIDNIDSVTRSAIANELAKVGLFTVSNVGTGVTAELLRDYLAQNYQCASDYGPMSEYRERFVARSLNDPEEQFCPVCYDLYCLTSRGCEWPLQCRDKRKACAPQLAPFHPPMCVEPSDDILVCDWDNSLSEEDCNIDTPSCIYCHNSSNCEVLPATTQEECENTPICLLPGGEILWDVSESDCEDMKYCTELCMGEECADQEACEEISGFCEDTDAIMESIEFAVKQHGNLANATEGVCVYPIRANNAPACPYLTENVVIGVGSGTLDSRTGNSWDFTTHRGCVAFTSCIPTSLQFGGGNGAALLPSECALSPSTPEECETEFEGMWLDLPIQNKMDCENPLRVDDEEFPGFCLEDKTGESPYLSRKGRRDCEECGGVPQTPAKWRAGRWVGGLSRVGVWRNPKMTSTYLYVSDSISFLALDDLLGLSSANVNSFLSEVGVVCGISPFVNYLELFSCDCGGDLGDNCQAPFQVDDGDASIIGGAWFCPGVNSKVGISVGRVEVNGTDVEGQLCKYTEIALANYEVFVGNRERVPLSVLGDPNPIDADAVRNDNGASVGEVVGDGIQFLYENTGFVDFDEEIKRVKLSLFLDIELLKRAPGDYVFDFGLEVLDKDDKRYENEVELRPLRAKLTGEIKEGMTVRELLDDLEENQFTVALVGFWKDPFDGDSPRLYPIVREEDYEDVARDDVLSDGEKVMVAVFGGLYGLAFLISLVLTYLLFTKLPSLTNIILCFFVYLVFIFRCVYLSMFAAGYFREEDAGSFVLVEPPSFFIITIASTILMSLGFTLYCLANHVQQDQAFSKFWTFWLFFNLFIYLILAVVLILETQLDTSDTLIISCYGRIVEVDESFTIQAIRIAYHSFLLIIAIVTCAMLIIFSKKLTKTTSSTSTSSVTNSLILLSVIVVSSVLLTSILWVVYSSVSGSSPYFVIPLFLCEAIPLLALMGKMIPTEE